MNMNMNKNKLIKIGICVLVLVLACVLLYLYLNNSSKAKFYNTYPTVSGRYFRIYVPVGQVVSITGVFIYGAELGVATTGEAGHLSGVLRAAMR